MVSFSACEGETNIFLRLMRENEVRRRWRRAAVWEVVNAAAGSFCDEKCHEKIFILSRSLRAKINASALSLRG